MGQKWHTCEDGSRLRPDRLLRPRDAIEECYAYTRKRRKIGGEPSPVSNVQAEANTPTLRHIPSAWHTARPTTYSSSVQQIKHTDISMHKGERPTQYSSDMQSLLVLARIEVLLWHRSDILPFVGNKRITLFHDRTRAIKTVLKRNSRLILHPETARSASKTPPLRSHRKLFKATLGTQLH